MFYFVSFYSTDIASSLILYSLVFSLSFSLVSVSLVVVFFLSLVWFSVIVALFYRYFSVLYPLYLMISVIALEPSLSVSWHIIALFSVPPFWWWITFILLIFPYSAIIFCSSFPSILSSLYYNLLFGVLVSHMDSILVVVLLLVYCKFQLFSLSS